METVDLSERTAVEAVAGVHLAQLAAGDRTSVQHYHFVPGAAVPEHHHEHEQVGFVYDGSLTFTVGENEFVVGTGESYAIATDEPHAVRNRGEDPARGIDVFSPPRLNPAWAD